MLLKPVYEVVSLLGDLDFVIHYVEPALSFLDSIWGTFSFVVVGFILIYKASRERPMEEKAEAQYEPLPEQETEQLRAENKRLRMEKSQLEGKLKVRDEFGSTGSVLPIIKSTSPRLDLSNTSSTLGLPPLEKPKPTGMMYFVEETQRLQKENKEIKTERDALKKTLEQSGTQKSDGASDEEDE